MKTMMRCVRSATTRWHRLLPAAGALALAACGSLAPSPSPLDEARRLIDQQAYAQGLRLLQPWLLAEAPGAGAATGTGAVDARRGTEARLLLARVRFDCTTRGPDRDDPGFCHRLTQVPAARPETPMPAPTPTALPAPVPLLASPAAPPGSRHIEPAVGKPLRAKAAVTQAGVAKPVPVPAAEALAPLDRPVSLRFTKAGLASVFGVIGLASGLDVLFDRDVPADQLLSIRLQDAPAQTALNKVALAAGLAWRLLDARTVLVYPDVARKQSDYQALQVRSFFLEHADARFVAASLRTVLKSRDIVVDDKLNMIVLRDTAEALRQTEQLVRLHDVPEPEVLLDVQVLEVKRSLLKQLGVQWPGQLTLGPLPLQLQAPGNAYDPAVPLTLRDLLAGTPGRLGLGLSSPLTVNARREDGDINTLASPRLRAKNRERARILIGERVPNVTATSTATGLVAESVAYVDVGLKLEVQPQVFAGDEVLIRLDLEVSNLIDTTQTRSGTLAYRIGTRNANTVLRLRDGENQLLAGLIQDSDQRSAAQVPGLGSLPWIGRLFGAQRDETAKTEIVLSITPRLIRPISAARRGDRGFDAGTASGVRGRSDPDAAPSDSAAAPASAGSAPMTAPVAVPSAPVPGGPFGAAAPPTGAWPNR